MGLFIVMRQCHQLQSQLLQGDTLLRYCAVYLSRTLAMDTKLKQSLGHAVAEKKQFWSYYVGLPFENYQALVLRFEKRQVQIQGTYENHFVVPRSSVVCVLAISTTPRHLRLLVRFRAFFNRNFKMFYQMNIGKAPK